MIKKKIAILLPYKENFSESNAGAASIWVKDYLSLSKLKGLTNVYGNLKKKPKAIDFKFYKYRYFRKNS